MPLKDAKSDQTAATRKGEDFPCSAVEFRLGPQGKSPAEIACSCRGEAPDCLSSS
jgi:hypothetical protein